MDSAVLVRSPLRAVTKVIVANRRGDHADTVEHLLVVVPFILGIGCRIVTISTKTAMLGTWFVGAIKL